MSYTMQFVRGRSPCGHWDIGYRKPDDLTHPEAALVDDIKTAIGKTCLKRCEGEVCNLIFETEPTAEEKTTVENLVSAHKTAADHT